MINENIRHGDLEEVISSNISIDEYEPKTGKKENISVIGFYVTEEKVGADLKNFLQKSHFNFRDVEVTPNPNEDNLYMVFVEVDREEGLLDKLKEYVLDIENTSGKMNWKVKPLLSDDSYDITDPLLDEYVITDPDKYMTKEEFEAEKKSKKEESIVNFLKDNATIQNAVLENDILTLKDYKYNIQLEFVQFGEGKVTLEEAGISEAAIDYDWDKSLVKTLESMRGSLNVIPINKHIVFHNPATDQVLIAKPC